MPIPAEIESKIAENAEKLKTLTAPDQKRVKKRVLQNLGKLKKQLAALKGGASSNNAHDVEGGSGSNLVAAKAAEQPQPLSRKQKKAKLNLLNRELAEYAQKKQLKMAKKRFGWGIRKGIVDIHTYANLLNAHVRCSDLDGAVQVFNSLCAAKYTPNIVIYTTLLKGYCESGDIRGARQLLFRDMIENANIEPSARTINTILRGCVRIGAVNTAKEVVNRLVLKAEGSAAVHASSGSVGSKSKKLANVKKDEDRDNSGSDDGDDSKDSSSDSDDVPLVAIEDDDNDDDEEPTGEGDASTYEYAVNLLCQSLRVREAAVLAAKAISASTRHSNNNSNNSSTSASALPDVVDSASLYLSLAKATALLGAWDEADKWVSLTTGALDRSKSSQLRNNMLQKFNLSSNVTAATAAAATGSGGGGGGGEQSVEDVKRERSADLFAKHRRAEIEHELESLQGFVAAGRAYIESSTPKLEQGIQTTIEGVSVISALSREVSAAGLCEALSRTMYFGVDGHGDLDSSRDILITTVTATAGEGGSTDTTGANTAAVAAASGVKRKREGGSEGAGVAADSSSDKGATDVLVASVSDSDSIASQLVSALNDKFGLDNLGRNDAFFGFDDLKDQQKDQEKQQQQQLRKKQKKDSAKTDTNAEKATTQPPVSLDIHAVRRDAILKIERSFSEQNSSGFIDFRSLFALTDEDRKKSGGTSNTAAAISGDIDVDSDASSDSDDDHASDEEDEEEDSSSGSKRKSSDHDLPINLEIGSGYGEWVVTQASADLYYPDVHKQQQQQKTDNEDDSSEQALTPLLSQRQRGCPPPQPRALWMSLELRCDRVYSTLCKSIMQNMTEGPQYEQMWKHQNYSHSTHSQPQSLQQQLSLKLAAGSGGEISAANNSIAIRADAAAYGNQNHGDASAAVFDIRPIATAHFAGLRNLAILGGDATKVLPQRIAPGSLSAIFINHPEPPERTGGEGDSQGKHLLTQEFFAQMHRVLKPNGTITIVTDNLPYGKSLMAAVANTTAEAVRANQKNKIATVRSGGQIAMPVRNYPVFVSVPLESDDDTSPRVLQESVDIMGIVLTEGESAAAGTTGGASATSKSTSVTATTSGSTTNAVSVKAAAAVVKGGGGGGGRRGSASSGKESKKRFTSSVVDDSDDDSDDSDDDDDESVVDIGDDGAFVYDNDGEFGAAITSSVKNKAGAAAVGGSGKQQQESKGGKKGVSMNNKGSKNKNAAPTVVPTQKKSSSGVPKGPVVQLWRGPCTDIEGSGGHTVEASSYFDRLWERGQKKRRWFLLLKKYEV